MIMAAVLELARDTMAYHSPFLLADEPPRNINSDHFMANDSDENLAFGVADYIACDDQGSSFGENMVFPIEESGDSGLDSNGPGFSGMNCGEVAERVRMDVGHRIGFRTKSEVEILDDGYKWRKYGKKSVKNSPNPRNYYRCSSEGCCVKKRVERDREDPSYVLTTYDGVHNHIRPGVVYYNTNPPGYVSAWGSSAQMPLFVFPNT